VADRALHSAAHTAENVSTVEEWRQRLRACVRTGGGHFEHNRDVKMM